MGIELTVTQKERFTELGVPKELFNESFSDEKERNAFFLKTEKKYSNINKENIKKCLDNKHQNESQIVIDKLSKWLMDDEGFTKVSTPTIITTAMLDKMTITGENPLRQQVYYVDNNKCLRPMLAPNLYVVMRELRRITNEPVRIFEAGSCFRKESNTSRHLSEFTMLNLVELGGVEDGDQMTRLEQLAKDAMKAVEIEGYSLETESSTVYKETLDIVHNDIEIASGSFGPHTLDDNWGIFDTWVGIGIGIERIAMIRDGSTSISKVGRSINALDGASLRI